MEKEILKLKAQSLITLRTSLINVLIVLTGGLTGLFFLQTTIATYLFASIGFFYFFIFLSNLIDTNNKLDLLLSEKEKINE